MAFKNLCGRCVFYRLTDNHDFGSYKDEERDVEGQLDDRFTVLQLAILDQSNMKMYLCRQRWALIASTCFNLMLIIAFVSISGGSYLAARRSCTNSVMTPHPAQAITHVPKSGTRLGLEALLVQ